MTAKEWLEVMQQAADFNPAYTPLIEKYGEMLVKESQQPIPTTERDRMIAEKYYTWVRKWFKRHDKDVHQLNDDEFWERFMDSESYQSIPPAETFEQELERRMPDKAFVTDMKNTLNSRMFYNWLKNELLKQ